MSETAPGYRDIPPEDRDKAKAFFERGTAVAGTANYDFAIEMYLMGLDKDPDAVEAHQTLRDIAMKRKASGGKALGMMARMKIKTNSKDEKANMLAYEKLLAYDPGDTGYMLGLMDNAYKGGFWDTAMWIGPILLRANTDSGKPNYNSYIALKNIYVGLRKWKLAADALQMAANMRPEDMDLQRELKDLGARHTMDAGNYEEGDFRKSVRDMDGQRKLLDEDKDIRTGDAMSRMIADAEAEWQAQPEEPGKIMKLVDALCKTEDPVHENRAIDLLASAFERSKQFRFRLAIGRIKLHQLLRQDRALREQAAKAPPDDPIRAEYKQFVADRTEEELKEYILWAENYPTDLTYKYEMSKRLFMLKRHAEAIPVLQTARQDPKIRTEATTLLGMSFLEAGFVDEAVDTLRALIEDYQVKGDNRSKDMYYWYARALEVANDVQGSLKAYSQVAQWDFNFRDVQNRIKKLRSGATA